MSETQLSHDIQRALESLGALVVRVQSGVIRGPHGTVRCARAGTPDLWVAWLGAQGWLEVKTDAKSSKLNDDQARWHGAAAKHFVRVETVRSVEAAVRAVKGWAG